MDRIICIVFSIGIFLLCVGCSTGLKETADIDLHIVTDEVIAEKCKNGFGGCAIVYPDKCVVYAVNSSNVIIHEIGHCLGAID